MPLDAVCLQAIVDEVAPRVIGSRIEKIQQPARDQVVLLLRFGRRLLLCANPNQPRLQLTELSRENPAQPPMFCMLLRKYLSGGRIAGLEAAPLERVAILTVEAADELGEQSRYSLILEAMGRRANLILCGSDGRILECLRRVDLEMSEERQVLPGLFYRLPPRQEKRDPLAAERDGFMALLPREQPLDSWLVDTFTSLPPLIAREIVWRAYGTVDARGGDERLWESFSRWQKTVKEKNFTPIMIRRESEPMDFTYADIRQYGDYAASDSRESFSVLLDEFYARREQAERLKQRGQDLTRSVQSALGRLRRKLEIQAKEYAGTENRDMLRLRGELLTANLHRIKRGMTSATVENYYEEGCPPVEIPLDPRLSPQENAARCFKQYAKAKTARRMLAEQLDKGRVELAYLESVWQELQQAESEEDFRDIRTELTEGGYLRRSGGKREGFRRQSKPREFRSTAGFRILVGRSNMQNDQLTGKTAQKWDIWFHTQKIHGSHVILCTEGRSVDEQSIWETAVLAAWYSQGRGGARVAVDYTPVKFVKKPTGGRPGMVVYSTYETIIVDPSEELASRLAIK